VIKTSVNYSLKHIYIIIKTHRNTNVRYSLLSFNTYITLTTCHSIETLTKPKQCHKQDDGRIIIIINTSLSVCEINHPLHAS